MPSPLLSKPDRAQASGHPWATGPRRRGDRIGWPLAAPAKELAVIGVLASTAPDEFALFVAAFRHGLSESGYVEGRNVAVEFRWAEGQYDRLPALADDLVRRQVAVIVVIGGNNPALAAKAATSAIPIIAVLGSDPVKLRLVETLNRPGGNLTGVSALASTLVAKRFEVTRKSDQRGVPLA